MSKAKKYKFYNLPKKYTPADYKRAIDQIIRRYSGIKSISSIYNWGDISTPGISDIDIVFVIKENAKGALPFLNRGFYFLNPKIRYLACHPFIFIDECSFKEMKYINQNINFKLLYGEKIEVEDLNVDEPYYVKIALLNDLIIRHYPRDFIEQSINKKINVRNTLLRLNSLRYTIKILSSLTKERNKSWDITLKNIQKLRKEWFKSNDFNLLTSLNRISVKISMDTIDIFKKILLRNDLVKINDGTSVKYNGIKNKTFFVRNWNKEKALQEMSNNIKNKKRFYSILPIELSPQLIEYAKYTGPISNHIKKNIKNNITYKIRHKFIIGKRIKILNKQATLASKLRHSDFAAFFDFGYRNKSGINNWILNLLDKVRF